jgi:hypothetical protein
MDLPADAVTALPDTLLHHPGQVPGTSRLIVEVVSE